MRVLRNAQHTVAEIRRNTPESSVELLSLVSEPLRIELHYEMYTPVFNSHPFFQCYSLLYSSALRQACHQAIALCSLHSGDVLFTSGQMPDEPRMFFIMSGHMHYMKEGKMETLVEEGEWACEAAIWTPWVYRGVLRAKEACTILALDSHKFQNIACSFISPDA